MGSLWEALASPNATVVRALPVLADAALKGVVVFAVAAAAVVLLRRRSAAVRHAIWAGAVTAQLAIPTLAMLLPSWRVPLFPALDRRLTITPTLVSTTGGDRFTVAAGPMRFHYEPRWNYSEDAPIAVLPRARAETRVVGRPMRAMARGMGARAGVGVGSGFGRSSTYAGGRTSAAARSGSGFSTLRRASTWLRVAAAIWLLGCLAILGRFIAGTMAVWRIARRSDRVADGPWLALAQRTATALGVARPLTLLRSARFGIPVTWGIVYPVVLLPNDADEWSDQRRRYVLVHEMAHVRRIDAFTQLIAQLALAAFWFNPLVWIAAHRMRVEREHACDDYVLREGTPPSTYAADLLEMVRALGTGRRGSQPAFAALAMARPAELEERMLAILNPNQDRRALHNGRAFATSLAALALLLPLAAMNPFSARTQRPKVRIVEPRVSALFLDTTAWASVQHTLSDTVVMAGIESTLKAAQAQLEAVNSARLALAAAAADAAVAARASEATEATIATTRASTTSCNSAMRRSRGTGTSIHIDDDAPEGQNFQFVSTRQGRCLQVDLNGKVTFSDNEREIRSLTRGGRFYVRERLRDIDRELTVSREDEELLFEYARNGEQTEYGGEAREWLAGLLPEILRESGLNAKERVARLRRDGGVRAVLADVSRTESESGKRATYDALIAQGGLNAGETEVLIRQAQHDLSSSDGDLRALLEELTKRGHVTASDALAQAVRGISSDGEKRALLQQYANGDRPMLLMAMREARSISSDGEKAEFLRAVAPRYLEGSDDALRGAFFSVAETISSDGDRHEVLNAVLPYAKANPATLLEVVEQARRISSDSEKAELLLTIARQRLIRTPPAREAFMRATRSISSDSEYRRVMEVALEQ
jgi:beta-lactamase regulating signal transducer with metallopeptidase domain